MSDPVFVRQRPDDEPVPRLWRLVVPAILGEAATLRTFTHAIEQVRETFTAHVTTSKEVVQHAEGSEDPLRLGYARGELSTWRAALETLNEELFCEFDVWEQDEIEEDHNPEWLKLIADDLGWRQNRPEFPIPDVDDVTLGPRLIMLLRERRDHYVALAIRFNYQARQDHIHRDGKPESPGFEEYMTRSKTFATTADHLEMIIAEALGVLPEYHQFVNEHGPWLERVI